MLKQVLIALDQVLNAVLAGRADETLSARCWRNRDNSWYWDGLRKGIDLLFFWQDQHCYHAYLSELYRQQLPNHYRK